MDVDTPRSPAPQSAVSWSMILLIGGGVWLVAAVMVILWMWPMSGKTVGDVYYLSAPARAVQHLLLFALAALAYRAAYSRRWPDCRTHPVRFVLLHLLACAIVIRLVPVAGALTMGPVDHRYNDMHDVLKMWGSMAPFNWAWLYSMQGFLPPYVLGMVLIGFARLAHDYHDESLRSAKLWAAYSDTKLEMLSAQLQPHFLFNALHATAELVDQDPKRATTMLARIGDFLRHALESSKRAWVSVATEASGLEAYLAIQQTRFGQRLRVELSMDPSTHELLIPSLLLQPLVENAIEHGRQNPASILLVRVSIVIVDGRLEIAVTNSSPQLAAAIRREDYGHGLSNVDTKLHIAYGADASLLVGPGPEGGTLALIRAPLRRVAP